MTGWIKKILVGGLLACAIVGTVQAADGGGQQRALAAGQSLIGTRAPRLVLTTIEGSTIDLGQLYGKQAVYLKFWATWCVPCRQQMPHFEHTYENAGPDLAVVAINTGFNDSVEEITKFREQTHISMPIVMDDGKAAAAFHLRVTPQHIVIGRDGKILYVGHLADATLDAALATARHAPPRDTAKATTTAAIAGATPPAIATHRPGDLVRAERVRTIDGRTLTLSDPARQRPTVLVFVSPWCESYLATTRPALSAGCRAMREKVDAMANQSAVRWVGIASGLWASTQDLRDYRKRYGVLIPLSLDTTGDRFRAFDVTQVPTALLIDPQGRLQRAVTPNELASLAAPRTAASMP